MGGSWNGCGRASMSGSTFRQSDVEIIFAQGPTLNWRTRRQLVVIWAPETYQYSLTAFGSANYFWSASSYCLGWIWTDRVKGLDWNAFIINGIWVFGDAVWGDVGVNWSPFIIIFFHHDDILILHFTFYFIVTLMFMHLQLPFVYYSLRIIIFIYIILNLYNNNKKKIK